MTHSRAWNRMTEDLHLVHAPWVHAILFSWGQMDILLFKGYNSALSSVFPQTDSGKLSGRSAIQPLNPLRLDNFLKEIQGEI
ncbi:hypothetical protein M413DRAFT_444826 [Hebeloma cylindrosporum]|uniref:Uncharacterized protein n=1 Tax=Hebeloma cylindrosporum TaxID=76867 RepID=A0A0C2YMZ4_HEBCY|nr:hypothetical protein M413DRAFT_444826 [Hebeloma cylindrosporum h7]